MTSTPTKSQLSAELEQLAAQIEVLTEQLQESERVQLRQTLWLQGDEPRRSGTTQGGEPWAAFSGQYASRKEGEARRYGAYKDFIAYAELAEAVRAAYQAGDHLVSITAYERPCAPRGEDRRRFSDWVIISFSSVPRTEPQREPQGEALEAEPTGEASPF